MWCRGLVTGKRSIEISSQVGDVTCLMAMKVTCSKKNMIKDISMTMDGNCKLNFYLCSECDGILSE